MAESEPGDGGREPRTDFDRLIHEPARLQIVATLYVVKTADFIFLMRQTGLSAGNLSSHLAKLESAGYVEIRKEFAGKVPRTLVSLTPAGREAFRSYRQNLLQWLASLPD